MMKLHVDPWRGKFIATLAIVFILSTPSWSQNVKVLPDNGALVSLATTTECTPLAADPAPPRPTVKAGQCLVAPADAYDDVSELIVLNSTKSLVAISTGRAKAGSNEPHVGKLYGGLLPKGPFKLIMESQEAIKLMDHNEMTGQSLMMSGLDGFKRGGDIVILQGLAEGKPVEAYRRRLPGVDQLGFKPQATRARLIAEDIAVVVVDSELFCWNLKDSRLLYRMEDTTFSTPTSVAFSGTGKWMTIAHDKGFSIFETATGEDLGFVRVDTATNPGVVFHPDGSRLAFSSGNAWGVWNCVEAKMLMTSVGTEHLGDKMTGWFGNDWLMTDLGNVVDTNSQMLVWMYYCGAVDGKQLWKDSMSIVTKADGLKISTLQVPEKKALAAVSKLDHQKNLMVTTPGTEVKILIETTETLNKEELTNALTMAIERAGWKVNKTAKLAVVAKVGRGAPYKLQYSSRPIGGPVDQGKTQTVEIKPFTAVLEIRSGKDVLWTRNTENHVPPMLFLRGDETVQDAAQKYERPEPEFFANLQIPPRIPKKELLKGLGASRYDKGAWLDFAR